MENVSLVADLVSWIAREPKPYRDVMDAWKTSCPRLSIWEDAVDCGFLERELDTDQVPMVRVTEKGLEFLKTQKRQHLTST